MATILQFPQRVRQEVLAPVVEEAVQVEQIASPEQKPEQVAMKLTFDQAMPAALFTVLQALSFYANQGFDHGAQAREALSFFFQPSGASKS